MAAVPCIAGRSQDWLLSRPLIPRITGAHRKLFFLLDVSLCQGADQLRKGSADDMLLGLSRL